MVVLTKKADIDDITDEDIEAIEYAAITEENTWRVNLIRDITDKKFNQLEIDGFFQKELEEILQFDFFLMDGNKLIFVHMDGEMNDLSLFSPSFPSGVFLGLLLSTIKT